MASHWASGKLKRRMPVPGSAYLSCICHQPGDSFHPGDCRQWMGSNLIPAKDGDGFIFIFNLEGAQSMYR